MKRGGRGYGGRGGREEEDGERRKERGGRREEEGERRKEREGVSHWCHMICMYSNNMQ